MLKNLHEGCVPCDLEYLYLWKFEEIQFTENWEKSVFSSKLPMFLVTSSWRDMEWHAHLATYISVILKRRILQKFKITIFLKSPELFYTSTNQTECICCTIIVLFYSNCVNKIL